MQLETRFNIGQQVRVLETGHHGEVEALLIRAADRVRVQVRYRDHRGRELESRFNEDQLEAADQQPARVDNRRPGRPARRVSGS